MFHVSEVSVLKENQSPSTRDVSNVTLAALRLPAGKFSPIFSSFSLRHFPPFLDFALHKRRKRARVRCRSGNTVAINGYKYLETCVK